MDPSKMKMLYVITESNGRTFWTKIGVGFVNRDGSINIRLNCLPVNGQMTMRDYEPREGGYQKQPPRDNDRITHVDEHGEPVGDDEFPF